MNHELQIGKEKSKWKRTKKCKSKPNESLSELIAIRLFFLGSNWNWNSYWMFKMLYYDSSNPLFHLRIASPFPLPTQVALVGKNGSLLHKNIIFSNFAVDIKTI